MHVHKRKAFALTPETRASGGESTAIQMARLSATAGALAGAVARFVVGPLDVLKIRFQVQLEPITNGAATISKYKSLRQAIVTIVKEEGIAGLWRGTIPGQLLTVPYTAVQFLTLQQCKMLAADYGLSNHPSTPFVSGALAGAAATLASYPFDLLRTTLAAQGEPKVYAGMGDAARKLVKTQGVQGLYRGIGVTFLEIIPYAALQFGLYDAFNTASDTFRRRLSADGEIEQRTTTQAFLCGLAAGTLSKLGTHPLDVVKKRFQVAGLQRSTRYGERVTLSTAASLQRCIQEIARKEGLAGFYKGTLPSLLKAAPSAAVTFACYDFFLRFLVAAAGKEAPNNDLAQRPVH